jgi:hypothetical protein
VDGKALYVENQPFMHMPHRLTLNPELDSNSQTYMIENTSGIGCEGKSHTRDDRGIRTF